MVFVFLQQKHLILKYKSCLFDIDNGNMTNKTILLV